MQGSVLSAGIHTLGTRHRW